MNPKNPCPQIRTSVIFIDVKQAQRLLDSNMEHQRTISTANLRKIEQSIKEDKFFLNGQTVVVSEGGKLLDGQHRLQAIVNTGIGIWTVYVAGVPDDYYKYMDNGKARNFADILKTTGHVNGSVLAATINRLAEYMQDQKAIGMGGVFSHAELLDVQDACPGLDESIRATNCVKNIVPQSRIAWLHYLVSQGDRDRSDEFFTSLGSGELLAKTSPIFQLRARILNDRGRGYHPGLREMMALLIKTWNRYAEQKPASILVWRADDEEFPILNVPAKLNVSRKKPIAA